MKTIIILLLNSILSINLLATCSTDINMGNNKITNVASPVNDTDVATKAYVDGLINTVVAPEGYGVIYINGVAWLDRNLGASEVCTDENGHAAWYGDLYQWGRYADGHEKRNSSTVSGQTSYTQPIWSLFHIGVENWLSTNVTHLWSVPGKGDANGICPKGWSVPSDHDFRALEIASAQDAFNKIKLSMSGVRSKGDGAITRMGTYGHYWTTATKEEQSRSFGIADNVVHYNIYPRGYGFSVRCVKH